MCPTGVRLEEGPLEHAPSVLAQGREECAHVGCGVGQTTMVEVEERELRSVDPELAGLAVAVHKPERRVVEASAAFGEG